MSKCTWEKVALMVDDTYDNIVDWNERFFECPICCEPIYEEDYPEIDKDEDFDVICPVCEEVIEV